MRVFILLFVFVCSSAWPKEISICIGTLTYPNGDAGGVIPLGDDVKFSISIDKEEITVGKGESGIVNLYTTSIKQIVVIRMNGKPYSAFPFQKEKFSSEKLCMWLYWPHATWQLYEYDKGKWGCNCF